MIGRSPRPGDTIGLAGERQLHEAGDRQGLALTELDRGLRLASVKAGNRAAPATRVAAIVKSMLLTSGATVSRMISPSRM